MLLQGIALKSRSHGEMETLSSVSITTASGLENDFRGQPGKRQITLLSEESWKAVCDDLSEDLPWTLRRANLLVRGLTFSAADVGRIISINDVELEITRETDPCARMDEHFQGLRQALIKEWRGGVCC